MLLHLFALLVAASTALLIFAGGLVTSTGSGLSVQLGLGTVGSVPDDSWTWTTAAYAEDKDGLTPGDLANDEYAGWLTAPSIDQAYGAWPCSVSQGLKWSLETSKSKPARSAAAA